MANIAVDIDSTLYDFETPAREAFTKLADRYEDPSLNRGAYDPWTEWRSPADSCGIEKWLEAIALCHDADVIEAQTPFAGAVETCRALKEEGHTLLYISNRAAESTDATYRWLLAWEFLGDESELVTTTGDKKKHIDHCQYIIDDRPKTVIDFIYDWDWTTKVKAGADRIRRTGPDPDDPRYAEHIAGLEAALEAYYASDRPATQQELSKIEEINKAAAEAYVENNSRRAFVLSYPYNYNLTDIPHLYLAPTWAGLNTYMVKKGVLSEPAHIALGVLN